jgi:hypothetical protein
MSIKKKPQAWQVRKIAYGLAAVVVGVLGWVGVLSDIQADQIGDQIDKWLPILLGVLAPTIAASKTHQGSDSPVTGADVVAASGPIVSVNDAARAEATVRKVMADLPDPAKIAAAVVAAIRAEERGEHFTATDPTAMVAAMKTDAARTDYVYGRQ